MIIRDLIKKEIEKAVGSANFDIFKSEKFGDYSSNAAMMLKKNPEDIVNTLRIQNAKSRNNLFDKIEAAGPGFLNFWLSERGMKMGLREIFKKAKPKRQKIQVEFISANPTGELHLGHGRNAFYGNTLANVLEEAGYKVSREFFINDSKESIQIKELGKTFLGKGKSYLNEYIRTIIKKISSKNKFKILSEEDAGYLLAQEIQKDNKEFIVKKLNIKFDKWFSEERDLRQKREFEKTLKILKNKNLTYEKDGAVWLKTSQYGDDEDRVLVRSTGEIGYFLSDIAYHINKFKRGFDKIINIWGADHQGHIKRMMAVKKILGWKGDLQILVCQMVVLKEGGEVKKMSKRKGTIVLLKDLINQVGLDAAKWFFLEKSISSHIEFDMKLAKERSNKNPVYYVQYAGARMSSILKKANFKFKSSSLDNLKIENFKLEERNLLVKIIQFPEIINDIAGDYQVQRLINYVYELAKVFTDFYEKTPVLKAESEELKKSRLVIVFLARKILGRCLWLLGISAPQKM